MVNGDEDSVDKEGDNNNDDSDNGVNATILRTVPTNTEVFLCGL